MAQVKRLNLDGKDLETFDQMKEAEKAISPAQAVCVIRLLWSPCCLRRRGTRGRSAPSD